MLEYFHEFYPEMELVFLIENVLNWRSEVKNLGFKPDIISPYFPLLSAQIVKSIQSENMGVIPWTVNNESDIRAMIEMGVDGIISDYPDILINELNRIDK